MIKLEQLYLSVSKITKSAQLLFLEKEGKKYRNDFSYIMPALKSDFNSAKFFEFLVTPCRLSGSALGRHNSDYLEFSCLKFPNSDFVRTSDNRDVVTEFRSATFRHNARRYTPVMLREAPHNRRLCTASLHFYFPKS